ARFEAAGLPYHAARATARLSMALWALGRGEEALELLEPALAVLAQDEPDQNVAQLAAEAGRIHHFQGDDETAAQRIEFAFALADELPLEVQTAVGGHVHGYLWLARTAYARSDPERAESWLARISPDVDASSDVQLQGLAVWRRAIVALGERRPADALPLL